jgi:streptothricin acetyltransferase
MQQNHDALEVLMDIRPIEHITLDEIQRLITGYTSPVRYQVHKTESDELTRFTLELITLETPYIKPYEAVDEESFQSFQRGVQQGSSLGVYEDEHLIGIALAEIRPWNKSLWVWEFHITPPYQGQGIGRRLMEALFERSRAAGLRCIGLETQNTNVPAIRFYRRMGFRLDGIDLSLYTNNDWPDGEIALFMKRKL